MRELNAAITASGTGRWSWMSTIGRSERTHVWWTPQESNTAWGGVRRNTQKRAGNWRGNSSSKRSSGGIEREPKAQVARGLGVRVD